MKSTFTTILLLFVFQFVHAQSKKELNMQLYDRMNEQENIHYEANSKLDSLNAEVSILQEKIIGKINVGRALKKSLLDLIIPVDELQKKLSILGIETKDTLEDYKKSIQLTLNELVALNAANEEDLRFASKIEWANINHDYPLWKVKQQNDYLLKLLPEYEKLNERNANHIRETEACLNRLQTLWERVQDLSLASGKKSLEFSKKVEYYQARLAAERKRYYETKMQGKNAAYDMVFANEPVLRAEEPKEESKRQVPKINEQIYDVVDEQAMFPGGLDAMMKFIGDNIRLPKCILGDNPISGKVYLRFVIRSSGKIENVVVMKGVPDCPECDAEAKRVVELMPNWAPAKVNGKIVDSRYNLPIKFSL